MIPQRIGDYVELGLAQFTSQFNAEDAPQIRALTASYLAECQELEDAAWDVYTLRQLASATIFSPPPGIFSVTHGADLVACSVDPTSSIFPGNRITFASQPGVFYTVVDVYAPSFPVSGSLILSANYTGTSNAATSADTNQTNPILDVLGGLVGQQRIGQDDGDYQATIYLRIAVNRSNGVVTDWSTFGGLLLRSSGGPVVYYDSGGTGFWFGVWDMSLNPIVVAEALTDAVPNGVGAVTFAFSTWPDGQDFACSSVSSPSAGEGSGWGSVAAGAGAYGSVMVAAVTI